MEIGLALPATLTPALIGVVDSGQISVIPTQDGCELVIAIEFRRGDAWKNTSIGCAITLINLHGIFSRSNATNATGVHLLPLEYVPFAFPNQAVRRHVELHFPLSRSYITQFEAERTWQQPRQDTLFAIRLWGILFISEAASINGQSVDGFQQVRCDPIQFEITRSKWIETLKRIGYPYRRVIEVPYPEPDEMAEELQRAGHHLDAALNLFAEEHYRECVQRCRQARDALLGESKTTWAQERLEPVIGKQKAALVNEGIKALSYLDNPASHGDSPVVEIDRDSAEYVLGQLAYILRYIDRKLR